MAKSTAWLLDLDGSHYAAVGERQMLHFIDSPALLDIPQSPPHCCHVLIWQDNILPVMDLGVWLRGQTVQRDQLAVGIVTYQDQSAAAPQHGAVLLASAPTRVSVHDNQACELPNQPAGWPALAISCFAADGKVIPILHLPNIFSQLE